MSEMVERIALAIATKIHLSHLAFNLSEINQEDKFQDWLAAYPVKVTDEDRGLARVAIEAMREPTDEMCEAAYWHQQSEVNDYQAAIDAALGKVS